MWKLPDAVTQRFPLVARPRPAGLPLPRRIHTLADLADTAAKQDDPGVASTVYNQAALIASDIGVPEIARTMCCQHAAAYLNATPLSAKAAIRALEPVVNLARIQLRAGQLDVGRRGLMSLFEAITNESPAHVESITVPADLVATAEERKEVRTWLWTVLLADGTRSLTTQGRWDEALAYIEQHRGVGTRMLDGRQVAVLAELTHGDTNRAGDLLAETTTGDPWEQDVTAVLTLLRQLISERPSDQQTSNVAHAYLGRQAGHDSTVFDVRLGLTVLAAAAHSDHPAARDVVAEVHRRTVEAEDGYAARDALADSHFTKLATDKQVQECRELLHVCALGSGDFPEELLGVLVTALDISHRVIRESHSVLN